MLTAEKVLEYLRAHPGEAFRPAEIMTALGVPLSEKREARALLRELSYGGQALRFRRGVYAAPGKQNVIEGVLQGTKKGDGWVVPRGGGDDIFIPRKGIGQALHGDLVEATVIGSTSRDEPEGRIVRVVEHKNKTVVGQFIHTTDGGLILPKNPKINRRIRVMGRQRSEDIPEGSWVEAKITHWGDSHVDPMIGNVIDTIGREDDPGIDILVLLRNEGIHPEFPPEVEKEAASFPNRVPEEESARRMDLRKMKIFTIDPLTAKDFDDALSIETLAGGVIRLGVHIADVSHYVREGTALDTEAYERATSIYPVDRVVPMLPHALSSDMCSLRPNEDRLTMSVFMDIAPGPECTIVHTEAAESVIHSIFRLTYEEAQEVFDDQRTKRFEEIRPIHADLFALRDLSLRLTQMRLNRGALDLDLAETDIIFNAERQVVDIRPHPRLHSHRLVEECMLLANEAIAELMKKQSLPGLYRIHDTPDQEALERLRPILAPFGVKFPKHNIEVEHLQAALERMKSVEGGQLVTRLILRAMKKAVYSATNVGHFGLASPCYCHFTSPIRRYPDLIVHRVVREWLAEKKMSEKRRAELAERMPEMARHTSAREQRSEGLERDATTIKALEFIKPRIGEIHEGLVAGLTSFGMFVQLTEWPVEGLVPLRAMDDDYYEFDPEMHVLRGRRSGKTFRIADKVRVMIERVDPPARQMDLTLLQKTGKSTGMADGVKARSGKSARGAGSVAPREKSKGKTRERKKGRSGKR